MGDTVIDSRVGSVVDGRYQIVSRLARGGMATVYLAVDRRLDREVALKIMHQHLAEGSDFVARFRREARSAARLTHPGLVAVYDQGLDGETSYLTMEYIDGPNLRQYMAEQGPLSVGRSIEILEATLDALAAVHRAGLVHRDVKPENVLLATDGRIKLADFGLARAITEVTSTTTGTVLGTVAYLSPELVASGSCDARTDVYATGILLFEMLTGAQPFVGETPIQVAYQHVNSTVPAPSTLVDWLPTEIDELVASLTEREPDDRPADAAAALALLRRVRDELDEATLIRSATAPAVVPTTPVTDTDQDAADDEHDDDDPDATTALTVGAIGQTVALPIGAVVAQKAAEAPAPARPRRRRWLPPLVLLLVLLGVGAGGLWWYTEHGPGAYTTVPVLTAASTQERAEEVLRERELEPEVTQEYSFTVPEGQVISTDPEAGASVLRGSTVAVVISRGPQMGTVPEGLIGQDEETVVGALEGEGFTIGTVDRYYDLSHPEGTVLGITPEQGQRIQLDTPVNLIISRGPMPVTIPSVVGMAQPEAEALLTASEHRLQFTVEGAYSDDIPEGQVISQFPVGGREGLQGDTVDLVVSLGPENIEVPNVVGQQFTVAQQTLEELGFVVARDNVLGGFFGTVREQSVEPGELAPRGSTITLTVV